MKKLPVLLLCVLLMSCGLSKLIRKEISDGKVTLRWYFYSDITHNSPDIVEVQKGDSIIEIYEADGIITDIKFNDNDIVITGCCPSSRIVYNDTVNEAFGYQVIIDTTATKDETVRIPRGVKK